MQDPVLSTVISFAKFTVTLDVFHDVDLINNVQEFHSHSTKAIFY